MEDNVMKKQIIIKLARHGYYSHRMINFSDLVKSVPKHLRGKAKTAIHELYKQGLLNRKPGIKQEFRYSLRLDKKQIIDKIIERRDV